MQKQAIRRHYSAKLTDERWRDGADPKLLLTDIYNADNELFRDHCWVKPGRRLLELVEKNQDVHIGFSAREFKYRTRENSRRVGLKSIRCVSLVLKKKTKDIEAIDA